MTQYAYFDSSATQPTPVIGWYDTVEFNYPNLPASSDLLVLTPAQWSSRMSQTWYVQNGTLVNPPPMTVEDARTIQISTVLYPGYLAANASDISFTDAAGVTDTYQGDPTSVADLNNCLSAFRAAAAVPSGFYWRSATNNNNAFTYADLVNLAAALANRGFANFAQLQTLKANVMAATTVSDVQAVVW